MFCSKQFMRIMFCSLAGLLILPSALEAFPYAYRRLVLKKDGKIVKVVDLVSDVHMPEVQPKDWNSPIDQAHSSLEQGPTEKALLATLQRMVGRKNDQSVEIFGESSPERIEQFRQPFFLACGGMPLTLHKLYKEVPELAAKAEELEAKNRWRWFLRYFGLLKIIIHRKSIYTHADTYRDPEPGFFGNVSDKPGQGRIRIYNPKDFLETQNPLDRDIPSLKGKIDTRAYEMVQKLWHEYKQSIKCYCASSKKKNPQSCFNDEVLKTDNYSTIGITAKAMDFEVIMKILTSEHKHNVVIAGGLHCLGLSIWLEKHFNFTQIYGVGSDTWFKDIAKKGQLALPKPIPISTWQYLESDPFTAETT